MLDSIISNYLRLNSRLTVPSLGSFIKRSDDSEFVFSALLKVDDGVLVSLVMQEYSLERALAVEMINKFVGEIRKQVLVSGEYIIAEIGKFTTNDNGDMIFLSVASSDEKIEIKHASVVHDSVVVQPTEELEQSNTESKIKPRLKKKKMDMVMVIALTVTVIAILAMVYGLLFSEEEKVDLTPQLHIEQQD